MAKRSALTADEMAFVHSHRVARLATADEQGNPTLVPVCYAFDGTAFSIALDAKPKSVPVKQLRRVRDIETRPQVSLLIDRYDDDWSQLGYVLIHGEAEIVEADDERHKHVLPLLRERYIQYRTMDLEHAPFIIITPQYVSSWGPAFSDGKK